MPNQKMSLRGVCPPSIIQILRERVRRFSAGQGGKDNHFSFTLPNDADLLSCFYSHVLRAESLQRPLEQFLFDAVKVPALQAVALAVWREADMPHELSIYALGDLAWQHQNDPESILRVNLGQELYFSVNRAYSPVCAVVQASLPHISSNLSFINTEGDNISNVLSKLEDKLINDAFGFHAPEDLVFLYDAVIRNNDATVMASDSTF